MRSQFILRRTRALKPPTFTPRALLSSTRVARYPRKESVPRSSIPKLTKRSSSSASPAAPGSDPDVPNPNEPAEAAPDAPDAESPPDPTTEGVEKPKRKARTSSSKEPEASTSLPNGLNILWTPESPLRSDPSTSIGLPTNSALPPPEIFHEVLTNLYITLHPQTQHRAAYASSSGPLVEPTLALYCPIEGGDYIIDETVRELGRQAQAEVVVLDAVQLAAGECGQFGKAASVLRLPNNPLHFSSPSPSSRSPSQAFEDDDDDDMGARYPSSSQLTLHVLAPTMSRSSRMVAARRTGNPSLAKLTAFFDELINVTAPIVEGATEPPPRLPRIVYIRDLPTLAPSSATWYPALLAAVRARRQGPIARQSSPVYNPTTIVFGITPSIVAPSIESSHPGGPGLLNMLLNRQNMSHGVSSPRPGKSDYSEDEFSEKARERRLRDRLRKWERGDRSLHDDLPQMNYAGEDEAFGSNGDPKVVVVGANDSFPGLSPLVAQAIKGRIPTPNANPQESSQESQFFRTSIIVPSVRSLLLEKACRMDRRREINELTMRMGVSAVGGTLDRLSPNPDDMEFSKEEGIGPAARRMWEDWGRTVELWANVRQIADRAIGKVIAASAKESASGSKVLRLSLDPTPVDWDVVYEAWTVHKAARDMRKAWIQQSSGKLAQEPDEDEDETVPEDEIDEVVERVKRDPDLDQHEQRLLSCIVDTRTITTTFNQVHLPARTIDSVRTIVSLPLLHPAAFQHGILKEHSMTGCLLFGPPGTGKTLVVRALAKEAGCRMMAVSPSDVMDMYVGEGEKLVRSVFSLARRLSPCVVFIDEIDALFGARMGARESGGAIAHRGVITEFMQEMDGLMSSKDDNIIVIGATNRPFDLDDAVLRRLPRRLLVDLPGEKEREEILKILLRDEPLAPDVDLHVLAHRTDSFSGSDLKHLCVSAALDAVKERVDVPWRPAKKAAESESAGTEGAPVASKADTANSTSSASAPGDNVENPLSSASSFANPEPATLASIAETAVPEAEPQPPRVLHWRHFTAALKEITPSASEALGTLADLRKWNEEFGEGRSERRKQVWGKGRFGFTAQTLEGNDGKVQPATSSTSGSSSSAAS
ncbi:hypothetical protein NM688_g407 [Phlebia brevispora]|uniref:Uncharacterized protein n=1 Tax=Phlebia brevispora TaxID=194682 RepID=A0ACC1TE69_9APHY|nr:hypothetical protein NM688_g407 [Phlebia brevispora]